jgi:hypothetical protein
VDISCHTGLHDHSLGIQKEANRNNDKNDTSLNTQIDSKQKRNSPFEWLPRPAERKGHESTLPIFTVKVIL